MGLPHAIAVTTADVTDWEGATQMMLLNLDNLSCVEKFLVDGGYSGERFANQVKDIWGAQVEVVKRSEKIMPEVTAWQNRPLETVYPFVFLIHYKVKEENHQYQTKAAYVVLGVTIDGTKDILGVWIGEHESSKFWLNVLNDLKSRGVLDIYLFCVDGLKGFVETIGTVYPKSQVQRCIVHPST